MKYTSIASALFSLYNWSRQSVTKAQDYQMVFDIKSTKPKEELVFLIGLARKVIKKIESFCDEDELAILRFYFGFEDRFNNKELLNYVANLSYPKNIEVGKLIIQKWRGDDLMLRSKSNREDDTYRNQIMSILGLKKRMTNNIIKDVIEGKIDKTTKIRNGGLSVYLTYLTNTDFPLAHKIELELVNENLLFLPNHKQ